MPYDKDQESLMRWVLFSVFVGLFVVIVTGTLLAVFFGFGKLQPGERDTLFRIFLVEIGLAVVALFYSIFGIKRKHTGEPPKVRLSIGETADVRQLADVKRLVGKTAILSLSQADGKNLKEDAYKILDDNGPYIPLDLPPSTHDVYVTVKLGDRTYSGSFVVGTHLVEIKGEA